MVFVFYLFSTFNAENDNSLHFCIMRKPKASDSVGPVWQSFLEYTTSAVPLIWASVQAAQGATTRGRQRDLLDGIWKIGRPASGGTYPVSVASAERSFSKLKLTKSYLRNNMSDTRLTYMGLIVSQADIVACFAAMHCRKINLVG